MAVDLLFVLQWVLLLRAVSSKPRPVWVLNGEGAELLRGDLTFLATTQFTLWLLAPDIANDSCCQPAMGYEACP